MKYINDIFNGLLVKAQKFLWFLGLHAFSFILFFVFLSFILGIGIFYKYVFLAERVKPTVTENVIKFNVKTYQEVLKELSF